MKKTSIITAIFCTILFMVHCTVACLHYSGVMSGRLINIILGSLLCIPILIHMIASLVGMAKYSQKDPNALLYPKLNTGIMIQSATGIFTIIFLVLHVLMNILNNAYEIKALFYTHAALEFLFVLFVIVHLMIGLPKIFISLSLVSKMKWYGIIQKVIIVLLLFPFIMYTISSIQYHFIYAKF